MCFARNANDWRLLGSNGAQWHFSSRDIYRKQQVTALQFANDATLNFMGAAVASVFVTPDKQMLDRMKGAGSQIITAATIVLH